MNTDLQKTYDRIASGWDGEHRGDDWWYPVIDRFCRLLPQGSDVLDVGCGSGFVDERLASAGLRVTGIDFSEGQLEIARRRVVTARFINMPIEDLDSMEETYDGVVAQASLLHFPKRDAGAIVSSMTRRLNDNGLLYISVKEVRDDRPEEGVIKDGIYGKDFERFFSFYSKDELDSYVRNAGLEIIESSRNPAGRATWLQIIARK